MIFLFNWLIFGFHVNFRGVPQESPNILDFSMEKPWLTILSQRPGFTTAATSGSCNASPGPFDSQESIVKVNIGPLSE